MPSRPTPEDTAEALQCAATSEGGLVTFMATTVARVRRLNGIEVVESGTTSRFVELSSSAYDINLEVRQLTMNTEICELWCNDAV